MSALDLPRPTPREAGYRQPAEWEPHAAVWLAWPSHADLWEQHLRGAREAFVALCRAVADVDPMTGVARGEALEILVTDDASEASAGEALAGVPCRLRRIPFGDIWMRDTAPVFLADEVGGLATATFRFNGWGGKYVLEHDAEVAERVAAHVGLRRFDFPVVLEGGSVEVDGEGTCLTTRECLLAPNRNPGLGPSDLEDLLRSALGVERVLWLDEGLRNDHTDGHIDNLVRFVAPGVVVCMEPGGSDDPHREPLAAAAAALASFRDARGRALEVVRIPSPGRVLGDDGRAAPASYVNFYLGERAVVVPVFGTASEDTALARLEALFPGRRVVGVPARALLEGGGAFHCITQQQPRGGPR